MYVFGSVGVVLLTSVTLITELILKTVNGDRTFGDLRFIVFPVECFFAVSVLISGMFESREYKPELFLLQTIFLTSHNHLSFFRTNTVHQNKRSIL
ncbi:hypothetical protein PO909_001017 [Leuciscus waleckii]